MYSTVPDTEYQCHVDCSQLNQNRWAGAEYVNVVMSMSNQSGPSEGVALTATFSTQAVCRPDIYRHR